MRVIFDSAKAIMDGDQAFLCVGMPFGKAKQFCAEMKPKKYVADIKEYRENRSSDANAYAWVLFGELAPKLSTEEAPISPEDIYRRLIRDVGGNYEVTPIRNEALERWMSIWTAKGVGWVCEEIGPSKIEGYTNVRNFYGSSVYDTAQMSRLIDLTIQECKQQGIETMTPEELSRLEGYGG